MTITSDDIALINQTNHVVQYKLELLDEYLNVISEITGDTADVSFNIDATTDIRRTATLTMVVTDESWMTENFEIGWINKLIRFSIGLRYDRDDASAIVDESRADFVVIDEPASIWKWYPIGTMLLTSDAFRFDTATQELQISLVDLIAYGTAERGSQIGTGVKYRYETPIKELLEATIARWYPYKETEIMEFPDVLPYDIEWGIGSYPYDILRTLLNLFPWYEQYYDTEGVYHARTLPMHVDEPCAMTHADLDDLIIAEHRSFDFSNIKNTTEIYGKSISSNYVASNCTLSGDTYTLSFLLEMETLENNKKYCFTPHVDSPASPKIHIDLTDPEAQETADLVGSNGNALEAGALMAEYAYVVRCLDVPVEVPIENPEPDGPTTQTVLRKKFFLMGQQQIHVIVREMNEQPTQLVIEQDKHDNDCADIKYVINPDSPYACDRYNSSAVAPARMSIQKGQIRQVLYDGDYASIYTTQLAYQRGEYENYLKCRMNTDTELTTVLIPFLDVNQKIEYTSPITGEQHQYIIKSINMDIKAFTMTMKLARFYNWLPTGQQT